MSNDLEALAPRGPIKTGDDQWDVFLSYRSVHRPWVLRLYDQLRHLDYEVFMDQFVLTASSGLNMQLEQELGSSATAVLIWSSRSEESKWCKDEYEALRTLEKSKPGFRFTVLRVDGVELPLFARAKVWIDFSSHPDGPTGIGLLRLLHGLHGTGLSPDAARVAAEYEEAVQRALVKVGAARRNGDADRLLALAQSDADEWTTTAMLPCKVVQALIELNRPADARPLLDALVTRFPRSVRPQQLLGLALARQGEWRAAQQVLGELYELGAKDAETLSLLAQTWRDRFVESGDMLHLRRARNLYAEAFESTPSDFSTGVNTAEDSVILDEPTVADTVAAAVEKLVGVVRHPNNYRATAAVAVVQLIRRRFADAAKLYAAAVEDDPEGKGNHEITRSQARRLMDKLGPSVEERAAIEKAFGR
jgi:tetratricopeptide (TPR) repeat protein